MTKFKIRKLERSDLDGLSELYAAVYSVNFSSAYWLWKYYQNPFGGHMMYVAIDDDHVVGDVGCIPMQIKCGERCYPASQTCDVTIRPEHRKGGSFMRLMKEMIDENRRRESLLIYGFAIPLTLKICSKLLKFRAVCPVKRWVLLLNPLPYLKQKLPVPVLPNVLGTLGKLLVSARYKRHYRTHSEVIEVEQFDERFDQFWEERKKEYEIMVRRDSAYLNWRYVDNPSKRYKILAYVERGRIDGFIVLATDEDDIKRGIIMDIMVDPGKRNVVDCLLSAAVDFFRSVDTDTMELWLPDHANLIDDLARWGFVERKTHHYLIVRNIKSEEEFDSDYILECKNWYFTMGDSDYH